MIDIQGNLAAILKEKGISRNQVAIEMGVTSPAVSNWFNRTGDIKLCTHYAKFSCVITKKVTCK